MIWGVGKPSGAALSCCMFTLLTFGSAFANNDWTQWGGPNRDFQVPSGNLSAEIRFEESWRRDLGTGYSAILSENGRLFTMYRNGDDEIVVCLNETDGSTIWEHTYSAPIKKGGDTSYGKGPNSTPILHGDAILTIGFNGDLHCLNKSDGKLKWRTNLIDELGGTNVNLGYSQSPIIYDEKLILPIGGKDKGIAAINLNNGEIIWSAQDLKNSYSTPLLIRVDGIDQMIFVMSDEVVGIDPKNGKLFWTFSLKNQWSTHAFVPLWDESSQTLFVSSFRQSHALEIKRENDSVVFTPKWSIPKTGIGFANGVIVDGVVVGSTGGSRSPTVTGIDLESGKILWRERGFGTSNFIAIGDRVLALDDNGTLAVMKPTPEKLIVVQKEKVLNAPKAWTVPTLVGTNLYLRDQKEIVKYKLN